jgi:hypothetical protein
VTGRRFAQATLHVAQCARTYDERNIKCILDLPGEAYDITDRETPDFSYMF